MSTNDIAPDSTQTGTLDTRMQDEEQNRAQAGATAHLTHVENLRKEAEAIQDLAQSTDLLAGPVSGTLDQRGSLGMEAHYQAPSHMHTSDGLLEGVAGLYLAGRKMGEKYEQWRESRQEKTLALPQEEPKDLDIASLEDDLVTEQASVELTDIEPAMSVDLLDEDEDLTWLEQEQTAELNLDLDYTQSDLDLEQG